MSDSDIEGHPRYFLRWQAALCGLIIVTPLAIAVYFIKKFKAEPLYLDDLCKSQWRKLSPRWLLCCRALAFICMTLILSKTVASAGADSLYFYTQWTFALVTIYFALGTTVSAYGCLVCSNGPPSGNGAMKRDVQEGADMMGDSLTSGEKEVRGKTKLQSQYAGEVIQRRAGFWGYLMQILYQICGGAVVLTDIVNWCVLVPFSSGPVDLLDVCTHTLNAVFLLVDTALNSMPFPWFRFAYFVLWSCLYIFFQWVVHACCISWWPYDFLLLNTPWAPLWYFALSVAHIPCYGIYALIVKAKNSILPRLFPNAFLRPC
ncbi:hypothetical protein SLA2020_166760 [Shorea laevis]